MQSNSNDLSHGKAISHARPELWSGGHHQSSGRDKPYQANPNQSALHPDYLHFQNGNDQTYQKHGLEHALQQHNSSSRDITSDSLLNSIDNYIPSELEAKDRTQIYCNPPDMIKSGAEGKVDSNYKLIQVSSK